MASETWKCTLCDRHVAGYKSRCICGGQRVERPSKLRPKPAACPNCQKNRPCLAHSGLTEGAYIARYGGARHLNDPGSYAHTTHAQPTPHVAKEQALPVDHHYGQGWQPPTVPPEQMDMANLQARARGDDLPFPERDAETHRHVTPVRLTAPELPEADRWHPPEPDAFEMELAAKRKRAAEAATEPPEPPEAA